MSPGRASATVCKHGERHGCQHCGFVSNEPVKNDIECSLCGAPADRYPSLYEWQKNPCHRADLLTGIFSDCTPP
jgi:ribosomal protein L37E